MDRRTWIVVAAVALAAAASGKAQESEEAEPETVNEIVVEILGLESDQGQIGCRIFSKEDGFPDKKKKADEQLYSKPKSKKGSCTFSGYKPGTYAISVMHDLDKSGELKTSFV
jgi:uncharacterized protein (DUF2141 family)